MSAPVAAEAIGDAVDSRISKDALMMQTAELASRRSTCTRLHVGAVLHREHRLIASGYNGALPNMAHCRHETWEDGEEPPGWATEYLLSSEAPKPPQKLHFNNGRVVVAEKAPGCEAAVHAEANVFAFCARYGIRTEGAELVTTDQPCIKCAQLIVAAGIARVVYDRRYRLEDGLNLLYDARIDVSEFDSSTHSCGHSGH